MDLSLSFSKISEQTLQICNDLPFLFTCSCECEKASFCFPMASPCILKLLRRHVRQRGSGRCQCRTKETASGRAHGLMSRYACRLACGKGKTPWDMSSTCCDQNQCIVCLTFPRSIHVEKINREVSFVKVLGLFVRIPTSEFAFKAHIAYHQP